MLQQIEKDLQNIQIISLDAINETDSVIPPDQKAILRYRIVNNQVYCTKKRERKGFEPCDRFQNALVTLCRLTKLRDVDFIVNHEDGTSQPFYLTANQAPIFGWAKLKTTPYLILIPDYRSVSTIWFDDLRKLIEGKNFSGKTIAWSDKIKKAFWRGAYTEAIHRVSICELSKKSQELIDAGLTGVFLSPDQNLSQFIKPNATYEEHMLYKYLPVLDGIMCTYPGYQWRLLSGCLTLKQESDQIQWFYGALKPYEHYLPIQNDLSDLQEKVEWAIKNDLTCAQISNQAKDFVIQNLQFDDVYLYLYLALEHYSRLLDKSVLKDLKKTSKNENWIEIKG